MESIRSALGWVEQNHHVKVICAFEFGSRGCGHSCEETSDHDVHFIFARRPSEYLTIDGEPRPPQDIVDVPAAGEVTGWDVGKALRLLRDSNTCVVDFLRPRNRRAFVLYDEPFVSRAAALAAAHVSPRALAHQHLSTARKHEKLFFPRGQRTVVASKKYVYMIRPLLCLRLLSSLVIPHGASIDSIPPESSIPPIDISELVGLISEDSARRGESAPVERFKALITDLKSSGSVSNYPRDPVLDGWATVLFSDADSFIHSLKPTRGVKTLPPSAPFNELCAQAILTAFQ